MADSNYKPTNTTPGTKIVPSVHGPEFRADQPGRTNPTGAGTAGQKKPIVGVKPEEPTVKNQSSTGGGLGGVHMGGHSDVGGFITRTPAAPKISSNTKFPSLKKK
jgi:hypothetical protein